ncbi:uncharacterized protein LOC127862542 [Dreissena polymorpha]|uniref:Uncharacterized protein n=1 Tax=Dreissena polymorpha TaxID=45954 RepID=A0A9D3Y8K1_DREPO|nr:uncharacterized protein LOC127862542 [Dreissena polymorpha]KAH3693810.1 hypothetical protein DPMN_081248 [Dreissena polymorpha]
MSNRRMRIESHIRVIVTPPSSPGQKPRRKQLQSTKPQSRQLSPGFTRKSPGVKERPRSGSHCLQVPGAINVRGRADSKNDNTDDNTLPNRSRSYSPFDERKQIPCGSPTFERVLRDMLLESTSRGGFNNNDTNKDDDTDLQQLSFKVGHVSFR